jgi:hypothetical protein
MTEPTKKLTGRYQAGVWPLKARRGELVLLCGYNATALEKLKQEHGGGMTFDQLRPAHRGVVEHHKGKKVVELYVADEFQCRAFIHGYCEALGIREKQS